MYVGAVEIILDGGCFRLKRKNCLFVVVFSSHGDHYGKALPLIGIALIMVGLLSSLPSSWCRKCKNCCHSKEKEADTFGSYNEQLHSQVNH